MAKKIILHIGSHKTGTTSLQWVFHKNRQRLKEKGVLYPEAGKLNASHNKCAQSLPMIPPFKTRSIFDRDKIFQDLRAEIDSFDGNTVVMSGEGFCCLAREGIAWLRELFRHEQVMVVRYLRRQDEQFESMYLQKLKNPDITWKYTLDGCLADHHLLYPPLDYAMSCGLWLDVFGEENVILRDYHALTGDDIVRDFFCLTGLDNLLPEMEFPDKKYNVTPTSESVLLFRLLNRLPLSRERKGRISKFITNHYLKKPKKRLLSQEICHDIMAAYAASNASLARRMNGRADFLLQWNNDKN